MPWRCWPACSTGTRARASPATWCAARGWPFPPAPAEGKTVAELESALRAEIARVANEGVSPEELERVRTQLIAAQVYKRDSMMAQAMEIGRLEAAGVHWRDIDTLLDKIRSVTADEVKAVAKKYFDDARLTVAVLDPQPLPEGAAQKSASAVRH